MEFESERLYFERLNDSHFERFCIEEMDPDVMKYLRRLSTTEEEARIPFSRYLAYMKDQPVLGAFAIFLKETKEQIGLAVLYHEGMDKNAERYEIGYRFHKDYWGKGYGTETNYWLLNLAFNGLKLPAVWGFMRPQNMASKKIVIKLGYTDHGETILPRGETQIFSLTKEQYENF